MNANQLADTLRNEPVVLMTDKDVESVTQQIKEMIDHTMMTFTQHHKLEDNTEATEVILSKIKYASKNYLALSTEVIDRLEWFCLQYMELIDAFKLISSSNYKAEIIKGLHRFRPENHSKEGMYVSSLLPFRINNVISFYENNSLIRNVNNIQYVWTPAKLLQQILMSGSNQTANLAILEDLLNYQTEEPIKSEFILMNKVAGVMTYKADAIKSLLDNRTSIMYKGDIKGITILLKTDIIFGEDIATENSIETFERFVNIFN